MSSFGVESNDSREIVHVQIGNAGNRIGNRFWATICEEHKIDFSGSFLGDSDLQLMGVPVYFTESETGRFVPRSIITDLEFNTLDEINNSSVGSLFNPVNFVFGRDMGTGNNFAKGFHSYGRELVEKLLDSVRRETEKCQHCQGFQLTHALGGGTGSGFASLFITLLSDLIPDELVTSYAVYPSHKSSEIVEETYNATLATHRLIDFSSQTMIFDNYQISQICREIHPARSNKDCTWEEINQLIAMVMSGITSSFRFSGQQNADLLSISHNLIPFPRLHFFVTSAAPIVRAGSQAWERTELNELIFQMFSPKFALAQGRKDSDPPSKILAASCIFRGELSACVCEKALADYQVANSDSFLPWIPNSFHHALVRVPHTGFKCSSTMIANTTSIQRQFINLLANFKVMYDHKAFLHWFVHEGCDLEEFDDAYKNVTALIGEYHKFEEGQEESEDTDHETE